MHKSKEYRTQEAEHGQQREIEEQTYRKNMKSDENEKKDMNEVRRKEKKNKWLSSANKERER